MFIKQCTNLDCQRCSFSSQVDDGGGDYEDFKWVCDNLEITVSWVKDNNKPCGLPKGKYYVASYEVNETVKKAYLVEIRNLENDTGFRIVVLAKNKKIAHEIARKNFPYKSRKKGYSIFISKNPLEIFESHDA